MKQKDYENLRESGRGSSVELYECANCCFQADYDDLPAAKDLAERHLPGDVFSDVECPHCGALCFPVEVAP